ncbi:MAG: Sulfatase [Gaiellaceae bacterium]|nr:Sulfatase [Gaiellaceae bacterium]
MSRSQPNVLLVMTDQLVPFLTGAYGHPVVRSPHLDGLRALERNGTSWDDAPIFDATRQDVR